jgi:nicotinamide-nucleotide amidase
MHSFWQHHIRPIVQERFVLPGERLRTLRCLGIAESRLATLLAPFAHLEGMALGFRTKLPENQVKLRFAPSMSAERESELVDAVRDTIGDAVFGVDCGPVEEVIGELLVAAGETVATAESCTGGGLSAALTSVPGASRYFLEGSCVYANEAKVRTCGVDPAILAASGAVSEPVAIQLARGVRVRADSTYGIGTTGIAGPGGGTPDKPVGTVHIAVATPTGVHHRRLRLAGSRERVIRLTTGAALDLFRRHLQGRTISDRPTP